MSALPARPDPPTRTRRAPLTSLDGRNSSPTKLGRCRPHRPTEGVYESPGFAWGHVHAASIAIAPDLTPLRRASGRGGALRSMGGRWRAKHAIHRPRPPHPPRFARPSLPRRRMRNAPTRRIRTVGRNATAPRAAGSPRPGRCSTRESGAPTCAPARRRRCRRRPRPRGRTCRRPRCPRRSAGRRS